jgi:hypothetical protein
LTSFLTIAISFEIFHFSLLICAHHQIVEKKKKMAKGLAKKKEKKTQAREYTINIAYKTARSYVAKTLVAL